MVDLALPQTVTVPNDADERADQYKVALDVCQRNADQALVAYRRIDEKAEKFITFASLVSGAVFTAISSKPDVALLLLPAFLLFVLSIIQFVIARRTAPMREPVDGKWTIETAAASGLQLMQARVAAALHVQSQMAFDQGRIKARLLDRGITVVLWGFVLLSIGAAAIACRQHSPDRSPAAVVAEAD